RDRATRGADAGDGVPPCWRGAERRRGGPGGPGPAVAASAAADLGALEADGEAVDLFHSAGDLAGGGVECIGDFDTVEVDGRVVAAFAEKIDEHGQREGIVEDGVLGVDR